MVLRSTETTRTLAPGVHLLPTQGNSLGIETDAGVVVIDAGPGGGVTAGMIEALRTFTDAPVRAIVYSHGHVGYNTAVPMWNDHAEGRGDEPPEVIANRRVLDRYARYRETKRLQQLLTGFQFGVPPSRLERLLNLTDPNTTFDDELTVDDPNRPIILRWAPSETDDALMLWLPKQGILFGGAATPGSSIPNIGTPLRTQRFTIRWAETLEHMEALGAEILVQEFGPVVEGGRAVSNQLTTMAQALRWVRSEVVERMNRGMIDIEIINDLDYPTELFDQPYMAEVYGARDYIVRDLYREENGWWGSRNPTDLHPAEPDHVASAIFGAVDPERVIAHATSVAEAGDLRTALAVIDLVALAPGDDATITKARLLKADWCEQLAKKTRVFVSRSLYSSSAALLRNGATRWSQIGEDGPSS